MTDRPKQTLAELLRKRAAVLSSALEFSIVAERTPFFDQVLETADGTESFEALLAKTIGPVDPATLPEFPTLECLSAEQVSGMAKIEPKQQEHLTTCPWCKNMMAGAQPSTQEFEEILRRAKKATVASRQHEAAAH